VRKVLAQHSGSVRTRTLRGWFGIRAESTRDTPAHTRTGEPTEQKHRAHKAKRQQQQESQQVATVTTQREFFEIRHLLLASSTEVARMMTWTIPHSNPRTNRGCVA
jgi:hypothetical protein